MKNKFILSVASFIGLSAGLFCACSDSSSVAGTAEEPNQIAVEDVSSSSLGNVPSSSSNIDSESSSSIVVGPVPNTSASSSSAAMATILRRHSSSSFTIRS